MNATEKHLQSEQNQSPESFRFTDVMVGGTFDRFHAGHRQLLEAAFANGHKVHIGISSDEFIQGRDKMLKEKIQPYNKRVEQINTYLNEKEFANRANIVPLYDVFAPGALDHQKQAVVITPDSIPGAKYINSKREEIGSPPLEFIVVPFIKDGSGQIISSSRLRQQEES